MAAFVEYRQEKVSSGERKEKEKDDDLSLFVDFSGANLNIDLLQKSNQFQVTSDCESENSMKTEIISIIRGQDSGADDLLDSLNNITDYDWLLSPRRHLAPSSEMEEQITLTDDILVSNGQSTSPECKLESPPADSTSTTNESPKLPASSSNGVKSSSTIRRPSPSRKAPSTGSRSATPTTRPTLTRPLRSSTPTSRATVTTATKPLAPTKSSKTPTSRPTVLTVASKSTSRSSTPLQRPSILPVVSKPTSRSSTPVQRPSIIASAKSASRSSTPTQRPSIVASDKSASRSSTPTQRLSKTSGLLTTSAYRNRSSSAMKSRGSSPSVKSRPSKNQPEMLERSASASRVRPGSPTVIESNLKAVPKRITRGQRHLNGEDDVNPVLMGTKMVERVVNMRKLAPPMQDPISNQNNTSGKLSVSQGNSGFGRSLSKKSFDMALRHLDIRRSMPGNMRATITKVPASSVYSVRPESTKTQTMSASDSPLATDSSASSDHSETGHLYHQSSGGGCV